MTQEIATPFELAREEAILRARVPSSVVVVSGSCDPARFDGAGFYLAVAVSEHADREELREFFCELAGVALGYADIYSTEEDAQ